MPVRHVVMFTWNDDVPAAHAAAVSAALTELPRSIPEIVSYVFGADLGIIDGNHDYAVVADFDDREAFLTYRDHPAHKQFVADFITGKVAARGAVQFEI
ncbi:MAG: Dabb family protein [Ilumatobacteraceae bacterium]